MKLMNTILLLFTVFGSTGIWAQKANKKPMEDSFTIIERLASGEAYTTLARMKEDEKLFKQLSPDKVSPLTHHVFLSTDRSLRVDTYIFRDSSRIVDSESDGMGYWNTYEIIERRCEFSQLDQTPFRAPTCYKTKTIRTTGGMTG